MRVFCCSSRKGLSILFVSAGLPFQRFLVNITTCLSKKIFFNDTLGPHRLEKERLITIHHVLVHLDQRE